MQKLSYFFLPLLLIISGCATQTGHYKPIESNLKNENFEKAEKLVEEAKDEEFEKKDRVLYSLELGLARHYAGLYEKSNQRFSRADQYIDELYTKSLSNMGFSILTNNTELPYRGESYEDIYINFFKALNYANMEDDQGAGVEFRKMNQKLSKLETRYKRMASDYEDSYMSSIEAFSLQDYLDYLEYAPVADLDSESFQLVNTINQLGNLTTEVAGDTIDLGKFQQGELTFHSSALARYFGNAYHLSQKDRDGARIERDRFHEAFNSQETIYNFDKPDIPEKINRDQDKARVYSLALLGQGPIKQQQRSPEIEVDDISFNFVFPTIEKRGTRIDRVVVRRQDGTKATTLQKLEDINNIAKELYSVKIPLIAAQNAMRSLAKELALREIKKQAQGGYAGLAAFIGGEVFVATTENADLRTARLLPGEVHAGHFTVPSGQPVTLNVTYYSNGNKVSQETIKRTFNHGELNILETKEFL